MIRIFAGCSANGEDAEAMAMLEYTLRKHASQPVDLQWMMLSHDPESPWYSNPHKRAGWNTKTWATPFSAFRWAIPHVCNFEGRAIYMDVDMIYMADVAQLWNQTIPQGKSLLAKNETTSCVMLFDCARMKSVLPSFDQLRSTEGLYRSVRKNVSSAVAKFAGNWNCLDGEEYKSLSDPDIKIIHFTKVETQPHLKWALPRLRAANQKHWNANTLHQSSALAHRRQDVQPLVDKTWEEAQAAGFSVKQYLPSEPYGSYDAVRGGARAA